MNKIKKVKINQMSKKVHSTILKSFTKTRNKVSG